MEQLVPLQQQGTRLVLVDSGAGGVVFSDPSMFMTINPPHAETCIQFGNGPRIPAQGVGTVFLCVACKDTNKVYTVYLKGAYYVPQQPLNIISTHAIMALDGAALFDSRTDPQCVRWSTHDGDVYQAILWVQRLPYIRCSVNAVAVHAIRRAVPKGLGYDLTHATFGHMSHAKLKRLVSEGFIEPSVVSCDDTYACSACTKANAQKEPYHSVHDLAATHANHTLHTDLLHFPVKTVDGHQYLLLVLDEYTRYLFPALLKAKSEAGAHLLRIMKRANVLHTVHVKHLRSDNGGEFHSVVLRAAKAELGVEDEYVPPNCHQSNGMIERVNLTIASTMRAVLLKSHLPPTLWGEAALYAVQLYNLSPHSALIARKESSSIPHKLYMKDSAERMERLYQQLVPFGIQCNIIQTGDKPQKVKKLDPRSVSGIIVGLGPSTKQYRVMVLNENVPYRVYIVRHIVINAAHYTEYCERDAVLPAMKRFCAVHFVDVLSFERITTLNDVTHATADVLCATMVPTNALSRGSAADEVPNEAAERKRIRQERFEALDPTAVEPDEDDHETMNMEQALQDEREHFATCLDRTVRNIEPLLDQISIEEVLELESLRHAWLRKAEELQVSIHHGVIHVDMMQAESAGTVLTDDAAFAGQDASEPEVVRQLWYLQDLSVWACDMDSPSFSQALNGSHREKWLEAIHNEVASLNELRAFELMDRPGNKNVIRGHFVLKVKRDANGEIERFKARYVVQGNHQRAGVDYFENAVWAPTGQHTTLRVLFVHAATFDLALRHIDISTAFLHGELDEEVYVEQPPVVNDGTDRVWRLNKSLYGLKQAGRQWHIKLCEWLFGMGFKRAGYDPALMCARSDSGELSFIFLWVDDLIIVADKATSDAIVAHVLQQFKGRDLGEASWVLGMAVRRNTNNKTIELSQERMIENVLERFGANELRISHLPMDTNTEATPDLHQHVEWRETLALRTTGKNSTS